MATKQEVLKLLKEAMNYEERFLPEIQYLMDERILAYRLTADKTKEARDLLQQLSNQTKNHYKMFSEAYVKINKSDKDAY